MAAFLEGLVEFDLADFATQGGLRKLGDGEEIVGDAVGGVAGIHHLQIQHAIDAHLNVVGSDADLFLHIDGLLLQGVLVGHALQKRHQDVEARRKGARELAEIFDHVGALLRHDDRRFDDDDDGDNCHHAGDD